MSFLNSIRFIGPTNFSYRSLRRFLRLVKERELDTLTTLACSASKGMNSSVKSIVDVKFVFIVTRACSPKGVVDSAM
uniref:Uncharacterized protein n=1 Tax=Schistosoma japonicum TaxID=6182 RepID=Q5BYI0_SCHJA|nr:unknown [Schistosoma japonicum]